MTATYDITTAVGQVRLKIGDTDVTPATDAVFTDEELTYFLGLYSNDVSKAAAEACRAWAAKYATNADQEKIGDYSYSQKAVDNLIKMAEKFDVEAAMVPVLEISQMDLTGEDA